MSYGQPKFRVNSSWKVNVPHFNQDDYYNWIRTEGMYKNNAWVYSLPGFHAWLQYKDAEKYRNDYRRYTGKTPAYVTFNRGYYSGNSAFGDLAKFSATTRFGSKLYSRTYESLWM